MHSDDYQKVADYFVVAGLTDSSNPLDEEHAFPDANHKLNPQPKDPITDICVIDKTMEEKCPQGFTCIDKTPSGLLADLNHGSFTAHNLFLCYRRGRDKPPLVDLGVYYEGLENVKPGIQIVETTPTGRNANVNNKSGMGSFSIYLTYRRAEESAPQSALVVTDLCIILANKNEHPPYAYCLIDKNLNKGMIGSSVFLCYKKSMRQVNSISFKAGLFARYPTEDIGSFSLPAEVPLFCLPMGATIECWSNKTKHPLPSFSSFVLTTETSEKVYGAVVSFYESYPEENLLEEQKYKLGILRGDGHKARGERTLHTNKAICLLSRWPLFDAFRDFLIYLYRLTVSPIAHAVPVERHIAHFMHNIPFPSPQRPRVQYQMSPMHATIITRPQMTVIPLSGASFLALIDDLGAENTLTLLTLALTESKIVIHSLRKAEITRVAEALITVLFPYKWQCTYIPLCPLEMSYVLEAPCPFIVGVDSRYFDLYEPPHDVACVNLDTNSITQLGGRKITWKMLPRKPAKQARSILQKLFVEIKQSCPRMKDDEGEYMSTVFDPELTRTRRHMQIELIIQETILKFTCLMMRGYRQYLLPIIEAPNTDRTDPSSLFSIQEFIRSREKSSQRFYTLLTGTQLFAAFIEERSFASSFGGPRGEDAGRAASLVFFDECIDRLENEHPDSVRLIEADDTLKSEHTVFIMPPDEKGLPPGPGYQYTTFPELRENLFALHNDEEIQDGNEVTAASTDKQRRKLETSIIGKRTKQETRLTQKQAKLQCQDAQLWARLLLSSTYSVWYGCLTEFARQCRSKAAVLRAGHDALYALKENGCIPLPDEACLRVLMHLCHTYNKPVLAVRIFHFIRNSGMQLTAITYGLYNEAVLKSTWPSSNRDGYMLWQKLRNVLQAIARLRQGIQYQQNNNSAVTMSSDTSSEIDSFNRSPENPYDVENNLYVNQATLSSTSEDRSNSLMHAEDLKLQLATTALDDNISAGGQSDHGYNSMPKDLVLRGSLSQSKSNNFLDDQTETKSTETTDSLVSSVSEEASEYDPTATPPTLERSLSGRIIQPPSTLCLSDVHTPGHAGEKSDDADKLKSIRQDLHSDDTIVNYTQHEEVCAEKQLIDLKTPSADDDTAKGRTGSIICNSDYDGQLKHSPSSKDNETLRAIKNVDSNEKVLSAASHNSHLPSTNSEDDKTELVQVTDSLPPMVASVTEPSAYSQANTTNTAEGMIEIKVTPSEIMDKCPARMLEDSNTPVPSPMEKSVEDIVFAGDTLDEIERKARSVSAPVLSSPSTPEMLAFYGDDSKLLAGLSDSDRRRHQELCGRRPSSIDPETKSSPTLSSIPAHTLSVSGGISPLVGHNSFYALSHSHNSNKTPSVDTPMSRFQFDNLTAEDMLSTTPSSPTKTRSIFSSGGSSRSRSGSKLSQKYQSPTTLNDFGSHQDSTGTPLKNSHHRTLQGTKSLTIVDGMAMLTSTPMRNLLPEETDGMDEEAVIEDVSDGTVSYMANKMQNASTAGSKQEIERRDITDLALDPLSPLSKNQITFPENGVGDGQTSPESARKHLVEEIKQYDKSFDRSQSLIDGTGDNHNRSLQRQSSLPDDGQDTLTRHPPPGLLSRSLTFANGSTLSNSLLNSGSKLNSLLKATTIGMASKAKKLASNLAKDFNETVQTNLAYYTPEKFKGSLGNLTEDQAIDGTSSSRLRFGGSKNDLYSSQTSLRSSDSIHSSVEPIGGNYSADIRRHAGGKKGKKGANRRPLSMPPQGAGLNDTRSSMLGVPGANALSPDLHLTTSMNSLNAKGTRDMEVMISSCSKCHRCGCLVYDEEIMAGWMADESNLNTHCPFCNSLFVPFLNIEIKDYRTIEPLKNKSSESKDIRGNSRDKTTSVVPDIQSIASFSQSFNLPLTPADDSLSTSQANSDHNRELDSETETHTVKQHENLESSKPEPDEKLKPHPTLVITPPPSPAVRSNLPGRGKSLHRSSASADETSSNFSESPSSLRNSAQFPISSSQGNNVSIDSTEETFITLEPVTVPYLSPLVLRKELESLLENEGSMVLGDSEFVDQHPIIYWNLVWYFRRLNLHSNLFNLLLTSKLVNPNRPRSKSAENMKSNKSTVAIYVVWDNLKFSETMAKVPMYWAYHQLSTQSVCDEYQPYSKDFLNKIRHSIISDDVRGPLLAVLQEFSTHGSNSMGRRSAYREILYLVIVALGKESIDVDAFDRVYKDAYDSLTAEELSLARQCDKPITAHARECRNIFGTLDLYSAM